MNQTRRRAAARKPLLSVVLAATFAFVTPLVAAPGNEARAYQDQFVVKFKAGTAERGNAELRQRRLDDIGRSQGLHLGQQRRLAVGADVIRTNHLLTRAESKALVMRLRADPRVEYAEADGRLYPAFAPNDARYGEQWNFFEFDGGINVPDAWDITTGAGQVVAVLDTGITTHSDVAANILPGYDFVSDATRSGDGDGRDDNPADEGSFTAAGECGSTARNSSWHGTHVAGIVAAVTNNGQGVAGIAFGAKVQPLRVFGKCFAINSDTSDAIVWAAGGAVAGIPANPTPAKIINVSLAGYAACPAAMQEAIDIATSLGATVVAASGNNFMDSTNFQPGNCRNVVTVGAVDRTGGLAYYSNHGERLDILAPGGDVTTSAILSTYNSGTTVPSTESYWNGGSGTSKAAPHVAGVVALVRAAADTELDTDEIKALLQYSARPMPIPCENQGVYCGDAGIVDATVAVGSADQPMLVLSGPETVEEGNAGTTQATFTVHLTKPLAVSLGFRVHTREGSAYAGEDYVEKSTNFTLPAGQTTAQFTVDIVGDAQYEGDQWLHVDLDNVTSALRVTRNTIPVTIHEDDPIELVNDQLAGPVSSPNAYTSVPFFLDVPAGATDVVFNIYGNSFGGTGDADLYIRHGAEPTLSEYHCASTNVHADETCDMGAAPGRWFGMVYAAEPYSNMLIKGHYRVPDVDLTVSDAKVTEGNDGTKVMTFNVFLSGETSIPVYYSIATADGTALSGSDYVSAQGNNQTIAAGLRAKTFSVTINGDTVQENNETFAVNVVSVYGANPVDTQGIGTILNDDGPLLSIGDATVSEGNSGTTNLAFTVSLAQVLANDVTFNANSQSGTATVGSDFVGLPVTGFTIPAGQLSTTVNVAINGDTAVEADETLLVNLSSVVGATLVDGQGVGTITNDDFAGLRIGDASVTEGNAGTKVLAFTATLTQASNTAVTFNAASQSSTATVGSDFVGLPVTGYTIPAGQLSTMVNVTINGDTAIEADETLLLNLSAATGAILQDGQGVGTIVNDDLPTLSIGDASVTEGNAGTKLLVTPSPPTKAAGTAVNFNAASQGGTATVGTDFIGLPATAFSIPAGQTSKTVSVTINGDTTVEPDETLLLNLSAVTGATPLDGQGVGTIANDDVPTLAIGDASVTEGDSGTKVMTFTVSLSQAALAAVTYDIATANNTAAAGSDYVASTLVGETIPAGQLSRTFSVTLNGDTTVEANEILRANLTNASIAVTDAQGTGTIINDDGPVLSITDAGFVEGDSGTKTMVFTVSLSQASASAVTYNIATAGGTASAGTDYIASSLTGESIPAGSLSKTFSVTVNGDTAMEGNETFFVTLSGASVSLADGQGKATITNDDGPTLSISDASITEADSGTTNMVFTVSLSQVAGATVTFDFATAAGTALAGPDFVPVSVTGLKIPAGQLSKLVSVPIKGDLVVEANETLRANLSMGNVSIRDGVGIGTILNDD